MALAAVTHYEEKLNTYRQRLSDALKCKDDGSLATEVEKFETTFNMLKSRHVKLEQDRQQRPYPWGPSTIDLTQIEDVIKDSLRSVCPPLQETADRVIASAKVAQIAVEALNSTIEDWQTAACQMRTDYDKDVEKRGKAIAVELEQLLSHRLAKAMLRKFKQGMTLRDLHINRQYYPESNMVAVVINYYMKKVDKYLLRVAPFIRYRGGLSAYHSNLEFYPSAFLGDRGIVTGTAKLCDTAGNLRGEDPISPSSVKEFLVFSAFPAKMPPPSVLAWLSEYSTSNDPWFDYVHSLSDKPILKLYDRTNFGRFRSHFTSTDIHQMRKEEELMWCAYETVLMRALAPKRDADELEFDNEAANKRQAV